MAWNSIGNCKLRCELLWWLHLPESHTLPAGANPEQRETWTESPLNTVLTPFTFVFSVWCETCQFQQDTISVRFTLGQLSWPDPGFILGMLSPNATTKALFSVSGDCGCLLRHDPGSKRWGYLLRQHGHCAFRRPWQRDQRHHGNVDWSHKTKFVHSAPWQRRMKPRDKVCLLSLKTTLHPTAPWQRDQDHHGNVEWSRGTKSVQSAVRRRTLHPCSPDLTLTAEAVAAGGGGWNHQQRVQMLWVPKHSCEVGGCAKMSVFSTEFSGADPQAQLP